MVYYVLKYLNYTASQSRFQRPHYCCRSTYRFASSTCGSKMPLQQLKFSPMDVSWGNFRIHIILKFVSAVIILRLHGTRKTPRENTMCSWATDPHTVHRTLDKQYDFSPEHLGLLLRLPSICIQNTNVTDGGGTGREVISESRTRWNINPGRYLGGGVRALGYGSVSLIRLM